MLKVSNPNYQTTCELCSKLTYKTPKQYQTRHPVIIVTLNNFKTCPSALKYFLQISCILLQLTFARSESTVDTHEGGMQFFQS